MLGKVVIIVAMCLLVTACAPGGTTHINPPLDSSWIMPAIANIDNYHPGGVAESISPEAFQSVYRSEWVQDVEPNKLYLIVHRGDEPATDKFILITEPNEIKADIVLKKVLRDGDTTNIISIASADEKGSINAEQPLCLSFNADTNTMELGNLKPDYKRIMTIVYKHNSPSDYNIYLTQFKDPYSGYQYVALDRVKEWVTIATPVISLKPMETKAVGIRLQTPSVVEPLLPYFWEFDVGVSEVSSAAYTTELVSRFLISMRSIV